MRRRALLLGGAAALLAGTAGARGERKPPRPVAPVVIGGRRYEALHWGKGRGLPQNGGYVVAIDGATGREIWISRIYRVSYRGGREGDIADVFITGMTASTDGASLSIVNERGERFRLDLATRRTVRDAR